MKSTNGFFGLAASIWALSSAFCGPSPAQDRTRAIEELLPPRTLALVTAHDVEDLRRDFESTGLSRIWNEPEIQAFADTFWSGVEKYWQDLESKFEESTGARLADVEESLKGEVAIAFLGMDTSGERPVPQIVFTIEAKKNLELLLRVVGSMKKKIGEENPNVRFSSRQFDGLTIETVESEEITFHYAAQGGGLYLSTDGAILESILRIYEGGVADSLAGHPSFRAVKERLGLSGEDYLVYVNVGQILETFGEQIPPDGTKVLENLGLTSWDSLAFGGEFVENEWREVFAVHAPGGKRGLSYLFAKHGSVDLSVARSIPGNAHGFIGLAFDPVGLWNEVQSTVRRFDAGAADEFEKTVKEFERDRNLSVKDDLLENLTGAMHGYSYRPEGGSLFSSGVSMIGVKDAARFEQAIEKVLSGQRMFEARTSEYKGRKIRYLLVPQGQLGENPFEGAEDPRAAIGWAMQFAFGSFSWYVEDGWIVFSNLVQSLKDHIDHVDSGSTGNSLFDSATFQAAARRFGAAPSFVAYYDPKGDVGQIYNTLLQLLKAFEGLIRAAGVPLDVALLPRASTILRHIGPSAYVVRLDGDGMAFEGAALVPGNFLAFAGVGMVAAVGVPALLQARVQANETSAVGTLKSLSTAQEQFKMQAMVDQDSDGMGEYGFLQELAGTSNCRGGVRAEPMFMAPSFGETAARSGGIAEKSGYYFRVFLPGASEAMGEGASLPDSDPAAANGQETSWVAYAWPVEFEKTGRRVFVMNQEGQVYESHNYSTMYSGLENAPRADAAFDLDQSGGSRNLEGPIASDGGRSGDGGFWTATWR